MSKELVISAASHERRVAILEEGQLVEIYIEREKEFALVGSIYKGRVTRVLPGMQSAFVDIGLERDAFLYVSDFMELQDEDEVEEIPTNLAPSEPYQSPATIDVHIDARNPIPAAELSAVQEDLARSVPVQPEQSEAARPAVRDEGHEGDRLHDLRRGGRPVDG